LYQIAIAQQEIDKLNTDDSRPDIYEALGLKLNEGQKEAIFEGVNTIVSSINSITQARLDAANQRVASSSQELENARLNLEQQQALLEQGQAADVAGARRVFEEKRRINQQAIVEQRKAQRAQNRLDTITQTASLITASANIFKGFTAAFPLIGSILAVPVIGAMFGAFAAQKIRAARVTRSLGKGGDFMIEGGSHASGNDVSFGVHGGQEIKVEGGEQAAVFSRKMVKKYGKGRISDIVKSINKGEFEAKYSGAFAQSDGMLTVAAQAKGADTKELMEENARLREELKETVKNIPQPIQSWDDRGYRKHLKRGNTTELDVHKENSHG
jgi:hypothetical protein